MTNDHNQDRDQYFQETRQYWDDAADTFDNEPDHGLRDPRVRAAWTGLLKNWLPAGKTAVLDAGCGTGSLSVVIAGLGHTVTGIDFSPAMIACAQAKAHASGHSIDFQVMDAAAPQYPLASFEVLVCRHLLWALPDPRKVLERWANLLIPNGRMILIEGFWNTGTGLHSLQIIAALPPTMALISQVDLNDRPEFWGKTVSDERYALIIEWPQG